MKLIDKDAVLAEIESLKDSEPYHPTLAERYAYNNGVNDALDKIYSLEVKEGDLLKELVSEEQVKESLISKHKDKTCKENGNSLTQEPASEDLEKISNKYCINAESSYTNDMFDRGDIYKAFKAGAKWQKEQLEKNRLKHCNSITNEQAELEQGFIDQHLDKYKRIPTFLDAIEYGMNLQKEQLLAKAVDVTIAMPYQNVDGGYSQIVDSKVALPFGDNIKVLVIK